MGSSYHQRFYHFMWGTYKQSDLIDKEMEKDLRGLIQY
jgi:hypothetical protein